MQYIIFHKLYVYIVSGYGKKAFWYKNIVTNPNDVTVQVGFRSFHAKIDIIEGEDLEDFFRWLVVKKPKYSKVGFGWDPNDDPSKADFSYIASIMRVIRLNKPLQKSTSFLAFINQFLFLNISKPTYEDRKWVYDFRKILGKIKGD